MNYLNLNSIFYVWVLNKIYHFIEFEICKEDKK